MQFETTDEHFTRAIRLLAVLYVKYHTEMYISYMAATIACSRWLIPDYEERVLTRTVYPTGHIVRWGWYEINELSRIWKLDAGGVIAALSWAREEVDKHDPSSPQKTLPF
jgi:hypothetical protein